MPFLLLLNREPSKFYQEKSGYIMFLRSPQEEMCSSSPLPICPTEEAPDARGNKDAVKHYKRLMAGSALIARVHQKCMEAFRKGKQVKTIVDYSNWMLYFFMNFCVILGTMEIDTFNTYYWVGYLSSKTNTGFRMIQADYDLVQQWSTAQNVRAWRR